MSIVENLEKMKKSDDPWELASVTVQKAWFDNCLTKKKKTWV